MLESTVGVNPYQIGMIAASDGHNAASAIEEANYFGKIGISDGTREVRILGGKKIEGFEFDGEVRSSPFSAAGLAGVWAEANTREDIFDAMRAREVFATSGPRLRIRVFAGWDFSASDLQSGIAKTGYARGVPMGGILAGSTKENAVPSFMLQAIKDPLEAPLERLQIIKSWVEAGEAKERVYDVACGDGQAPNATTHRCEQTTTPPNLDDCRVDSQQGRGELTTLWRDSDFDATQRAFYYARVLQVPSCRWSSYGARRLGVDRPKDQPAWIQERAVSSPIWYTPELTIQ